MDALSPPNPEQTFAALLRALRAKVRRRPVSPQSRSSGTRTERRVRARRVLVSRPHSAVVPGPRTPLAGAARRHRGVHVCRPGEALVGGKRSMGVSSVEPCS